jgi:hypothetical protein
MITPKPTKARVAKLQAKLDEIRAQVYACGPDRNTLFSDCLFAAPDALCDAYHAAEEALGTMEHEAIAMGRAYRAHGGYGLLLWHK